MIDPVAVPKQSTSVTAPVTALMFTVTTWSAAPARMQASPPMMRRMKVFTFTTPICEPSRFWPVAPGMSAQFTLSVLICHWKVAAEPSEG